MARPLRIVALLAAYNEEDVIAQVVSDLIAQGLLVYYIDHASSDATLAEVERFRDRGVIGIERYPEDSGLPEVERTRYAWLKLLKRKEQLARELDADWFLHTDADELRESPWHDRNLAAAIATVDRLGFNAIDFQVFNFRPTHDLFEKGEDLRESFPHWEPAAIYDRPQIKCWKKSLEIALAQSGGHNAQFPGRRVFPVPFILRHYPIRGQTHGVRKVFCERKPRFVEEERAAGWHVQYDGIEDTVSFIHSVESLTLWDGDAVRRDLWLAHGVRDELERLASSLDRALVERDGRLEQMRAELEAREREIVRLREENAQLNKSLASAETRADELFASRTWRWTAPARVAWRLLGRD